MSRLLKLTFMLLFGLSSLPTNAGLIDFSSGIGGSTTAFSATITGTGAGVGVQADFSNPMTEAPGGTFINITYFGLGLGSGGFPYSFDVTFNGTVSLYGWDAGGDVGSSNSFSIFGTGVNSTFLLSDIDVSLGVPLTFLAGHTYNFSTPARCCDGDSTTTSGALGFETWNFGVGDVGDVGDVPEPSTIAVFFLGLAGLGFVRRKKA